jgi:hypothetical protein
MTRADFLTSPQAWTRVRNVDQSPVDYACAVERTSTDYSPSWYVVMAFIAAVATVVIVWTA